MAVEIPRKVGDLIALGDRIGTSKPAFKGADLSPRKNEIARAAKKADKLKKLATKLELQAQSVGRNASVALRNLEELLRGRAKSISGKFRKDAPAILEAEGYDVVAPGSEPPEKPQ